MATKFESDLPSSPTNDESDGEQEDAVDENSQEEEEDIKEPSNNNVADLLKRLESSGALIQKPKQEYRCYTCDESFPDWEELENHILQHVSLPSVLVHKLPSDDEDIPGSGDEDWSDEEETSPPAQASAKSTPQKIDISQILKKTGLSIKKTTETTNNPDSALNKLSGLGFTIKKNITPIKKEPDIETKGNNDVMQKLGKLGGIKLKLKSDGSNTNSFKVVNGLKDFKASDDEDEGSGNDEGKEDGDEFEEQDKSGEQEGSGAENDSAEEESPLKTSRKNSDSDDSDKNPMMNMKLVNALAHLKGKTVTTKLEPKTPTKLLAPPTPVKDLPPAKPLGRPAIKQTPKRGTPLILPKEMSKVKETPQSPHLTPHSSSSTPERRQSTASSDANMENLVIKKEVDNNEPQQQSNSLPLFSGQIKSERASPPPSTPTETSTPVLTRVKSEPEPQPIVSAPTSQPIFTNQMSSLKSITTSPLLPVTKTEDVGVTIIEINGDSNDEDDDCCVVSATPASDIKPIIPKVENPPSYPPPVYSTTQSNYGTPLPPPRVSNAPSLEKQHNFNWNAPDSKPPIDMLEKSADDIFESLISNTKKESCSLSEASEYISLDTLGPQHSCDVCNTRFTDISLLEEHKRATGHSRNIVAPTSSTLMPYNPSSSILSSLLPVKQLAEQVGKLSGMGNGPGFTHQQNVMINIQAYPGSGGMMPPQPYNAYGPGQNMGQPGFPQPPNSMYGPSQGMPGQYPNQNYMGQQGYGQFQSPPMAKPGYPGSMPGPQGQFPSEPSPYSAASPLQSMQQAVYGQTPTGPMNPQVGQMGPPVSAANPYVPASSPGGTMKPPTSSGIRIQNVQTFPPGQMMGITGQTIAGGTEMPTLQPPTPGQVVQMASPGQIRMAAGANISATRPRMPNVRGQRPTIRPGIQVHGQVRGVKPGVRMPLKRPGGVPPGVVQKKRPNMLLPGKHDNEDCQVMAMQKQREGLPMIQSVQGAKDKLNIGSQISITKKTVNKEASAMANVLASRGISVKQKQKSRSPSPERPVPHIPNLGAGVSIKHTSKSSNFSIPEAKVGGGMMACKICKKMFMNQNSLSVHMTNAHPQSKIPTFKCEECPASYPKILQLQHHKRVFHNVSGPNKELGLPVVDLSQEDNLRRLSSLGIYSFIPLANKEQANGCFGIPVISVHNAQNGLTSSLQALGADGLLSLGPLKPLPNT